MRRQRKLECNVGAGQACCADVRQQCCGLMALQAMIHCANPLQTSRMLCTSQGTTRCADAMQLWCRLGAAQAMARCADAMGRLSDLNDVSDAFYLEALQKCVSALRAAEHDAEGAGTKSAVADALGVSIPYYTSTIQQL